MVGIHQAVGGDQNQDNDNDGQDQVVPGQPEVQPQSWAAGFPAGRRVPR